MNRTESRLHIILMFLISLILTSCVSLPENRVDAVYVMVYDYDSSMVMDASVFIDGEFAGNTDVYGRLMLSAGDFEEEWERSVSIEKNGYMGASMTSKLRAGEVLYFKIGTGMYYAERAEEFLDEKEFSKALRMIDIALEVEDRKDWRFLKDIIQRRMGE